MRGNRVSSRLDSSARWGAGWILVTLLVAGWATSAAAQDARIRRTALGKEERDQFLDDLGTMRGFGYDDRRPSATRLSQPTPEMKKIRPLIDEFANEISILNAQLTEESNHTPRSLLSDAYQITADCTLLSKRARNENDHQELLGDLRQIDAAWGELSHRLGTVRGLSRAAKDSIANLDDIADDVRKALSISQQVNYRDLANKSVSLATDLENLVEDIEIELRRTQEGQRLAAVTSKARQQALMLADLSDSKADLDSIKEQYRRFREMWYPQAATIQSQKREYFSRSLRRIAQTDGEIARLLLMQNRFDKTQVVYLASALRKDIDDFFYYATLDILMKLPRASQVMSTASEFYGVCDNFIDTVRSTDDYDEIVEAYRYIEQAERNFLNVFGGIENNDAASALETIRQTLNALRTAVQVDDEDFNRQTAEELAAKIENLTDTIDRTSKRWLATDRQSFSQDCLNATDRLAQQAADLHTLVLSGAGVQKIRQETESVYQSWRTVYNYIVKCHREERASLGRASSQLTPALVQLRTLVTH